MKNNFKDSEQGALHTALKYLSQRQMTVYKLKKKLMDKGFSPEEIEETIKRLLDWKYIDDRGYAISYIKYRREKVTKKNLAFKLYNEGIDKELTHTLLDEFYSEEQEFENCLRLGQKLWDEENKKWDRKYKHSPKYNNISQEVFIRKKVGDKLLLKGFPSSIISSVFKRIFEREDF